MLGTRDDSFWNELLKEADTNGDGVVSYFMLRILDIDMNLITRLTTQSL